MKPFADYLNEVNYTELIDKMNPIFKYAAYKKGSVEIFDTLAEARRYSPNTERILANEEELKEARSDAKEAWDKAINQFNEDLRNNYNYISEDIYNFVYSKVYDEFHSNLDEMAEKMEDAIDFAYGIIKARSKSAS